MTSKPNPFHILYGRLAFLARKAPALCRGQARLGWCPICEKQTVFEKHGAWLRDQYLCFRCGSIPRFRGLITVLGRTYPQWRDRQIHESSPSGAASDKLARECAHYTPTQYFSDTPAGAFRDGVRCENLEALTFADESFDLVVTQDVLEHVFNAPVVFSEIARTLKPGGAHVFTVPVYRGRQTVVRARMGPKGVEHLLAPDYHGNPIDEKGSLVVREWGDDICEAIRQACGLATEAFDLFEPKLGLEGEFLQVFVTRNP